MKTNKEVQFLQIINKNSRLLAFSLLAIILLVSAFLLPVQAADNKQRIEIQRVDLHFIIEGQVYHTSKDQQAFVYNGRTYVPVRFASQILEKYVSWNQSTATVSVLSPTDSQLKQLKLKKLDYLTPKADPTKPASGYTKQSIVASEDAAKYVFFGKEQAVPKDTTTFLYDGTVYVPIRFFSDMIQFDVVFDAKAKSITMAPKKPNGNQTTKPGSNNNTSEGKPGTSPTDDPNKPTRESIVSETSKAFDKLDNSCSSQAKSLFKSYNDAKSSQEKNNYLSQGLVLMENCEKQVEGTIESMETKLAKYGYELGEEGNNFRKTYSDKKAAMFAQFTS